jgi:hypothetical protein
MSTLIRCEGSDKPWQYATRSVDQRRLLTQHVGILAMQPALLGAQSSSYERQGLLVCALNCGPAYL